MDNYVRFFDTTLRDGEQSPGATLTSAEKIEVARQLARLGVDIIEAGFPIASPDDLAAVQRISAQVGRADELRAWAEDSVRPPVICGLARASEEDIDAAWEAIQSADRPRIHTFLATSEIHMRHKLRMDPEEVVDRVQQMVAYAKGYCEDVEFSPEDAGRSDPEFLYVVLAEAIKCGATTLNIPDTVGYTTPDEFGALIAGIIANTAGIEDIIVSVHCHDDLGMATANTLAGIRAGARQAEVTINGIGERAGNTSLEEVVMALHTRRPIFNLEHGIDTTQITRSSRMVSKYTGIVVQPNKAVVGANAFAHEAGIHQDGMLKHEETYEIMRPETVGLSQSTLVLGKHSGRHALRVRLQELGFDLNDEELKDVFTRYKRVAEKKKVVADADLVALITDEIYQPAEVFHLKDAQVVCGTLGMPTATVRMVGPDGEESEQAAIGTGPVDACYSAIDAIVQLPNELQEYKVNAVTEGIDALGEVTVRIQIDPEQVAAPTRLSPQREQLQYRTFGGHGASTDVFVASARAYVNALNKALAALGLPAEKPAAALASDSEVA
ncbi:MAG TPA: 2-isopropylmalate synthase [Anaerolineales bacterium]|jgi:2-isopropylmalate synthase|nr:2-isopropylmalate synthase [Anaerolineales bacterium]|tara:strand:- start:1633 stop:3294 length:1662 start_codon:yes stop_codon:yes gene_type:complete